MNRKINCILIVFVLLITVVFINFGTDKISVADFSRVSHGSVDRIEYPVNIDELRSVIVQADKPIAVAGSKYSMGGQTWVQDGIVIDMKHLRAITAFDPKQKKVTVQAGACWKDLQEFLYPHNLTVQVMQSFNDFSIGGSLSVNVHGRDLHGQLIETVEAVSVMLANGSLVKVSRTENQDLFSAVIGGYGLCGVIVDVTIRLEDNYNIKRVMTVVDVDKFVSFYQSKIKNNSQIALFNGCLYAPDFDKVINFAWYKTQQSLTIIDPMKTNKIHLQGMKRYGAHSIEFALSEFETAQKIRYLLDKKIVKYLDLVVLRSYEMSHSVQELPSSTEKTSKILQEYFIPVKNFHLFVQSMKKIFNDFKIKVLNVSIRYVPKNNESLLTYAPQDCFAFVIYIALDNCPKDHICGKIWTRKLIDASLKYQGTYYLPYHLFASQEQLLQAYPRYQELLALKQKYDSTNLFQNSLTRAYQDQKN